jgi:hypothetical protein
VAPPPPRAGGPEPVGAGPPEPGDQRPGCHAPGGRLRIVTEEVEVGTPLEDGVGTAGSGEACLPPGGGFGGGGGPGPPPPDLRALLHHEGNGAGDGVGPGHGLRDRPAVRGAGPRGRHPRGRSHLHRLPSPPGRGGGGGGKGPTDAGIQGTGRLAAAPSPGTTLPGTRDPGRCPDVRTSRGGTPWTFLLVEDDAGVAGLIRRALERAGHRVLVTHHPRRRRSSSGPGPPGWTSSSPTSSCPTSRGPSWRPASGRWTRASGSSSSRDTREPRRGGGGRARARCLPLEALLHRGTPGADRGAPEPGGGEGRRGERSTP